MQPNAIQGWNPTLLSRIGPFNGRPHFSVGRIIKQFVEPVDHSQDQLMARSEQLRNEFRLVSRKIEGLSQLSSLRRPGFALLAQLAAETLKLSRQIELELRLLSESQNLSARNFEPVELLIDKCSDCQDRLQRQLALVAQLRDDATELRDELNLLVMRGRDRAGSLSFDGIKGLARRIISELICDVTPPILHARLAFEVLTELWGSRADAEIHAVAFATAQSVARVARVTWLRHEHIELVTAGALLQECQLSLMTDEDRDENSVSERGDAGGPASRIVDLHPIIGAALISGYRDAPVGLASIVSQHHERLNGTGAPRRTTGQNQNDFCRLVAVASRLERLRLRFANESDLMSTVDQAEGPAMEQLWAEALHGDWDRGLTRKLLIQRDAPEALRIALEDAEGHAAEIASAA